MARIQTTKHTGADQTNGSNASTGSRKSTRSGRRQGSSTQQQSQVNESARNDKAVAIAESQQSGTTETVSTTPSHIQRAVQSGGGQSSLNYDDVGGRVVIKLRLLKAGLGAPVKLTPSA